ncbi:hypothetical protein LCGC14_0371520 [marine sediment metagenome]|uniref:Uncharacterized protein n=1 Tax=marine sediment metagenome TaxID=412755 RepID=A0A0F9T543_9ZZZZ
MIRIAKQRILESKLNISEKSALLENYQKFEAELNDFFNIEIIEVKVCYKSKKKK